MTPSKLSNKAILLVSGIGLAAATIAGSQPAAAQFYSDEYRCPAGYGYDPSYDCTRVTRMNPMGVGIYLAARMDAITAGTTNSGTTLPMASEAALRMTSPAALFIASAPAWPMAWVAAIASAAAPFRPSTWPFESVSYFV